MYILHYQSTEQRSYALLNGYLFKRAGIGWQRTGWIKAVRC